MQYPQTLWRPLSCACIAIGSSQTSAVIGHVESLHPVVAVEAVKAATRTLLSVQGMVSTPYLASLHSDHCSPLSNEPWSLLRVNQGEQVLLWEDMLLKGLC